MTIGKKLFLGIGAALLLNLVAGLFAWQGFNSVSGQVNKLVGTNARKVFISADLDTTMAEVIAAERGILLRAYMNDYATVETYKGQQADAFARLQKDAADFAALNETEEGRALLATVQEHLPGIRENHTEMTGWVDKHDLAAASNVLAAKVGAQPKSGARGQPGSDRTPKRTHQPDRGSRGGIHCHQTLGHVPARAPLSGRLRRGGLACAQRKHGVAPGRP